MAKIHINLQQGIIEIEGDEGFVKEAFADVRSSMGAFNAKPMANGGAESRNDTSDDPPVLPKAKERRRKTAGATLKPAAQTGIPKYYKPSLNSSLNLASLDEFYSGFDPKNNRDKILIFAAYLRDKLALNPCHADDIYSCYWSMREVIGNIPVAFGKNIADAVSEGFVECTGPSDIAVTIAGQNELQRLKKKEA